MCQCGGGGGRNVFISDWLTGRVGLIRRLPGSFHSTPLILLSSSHSSSSPFAPPNIPIALHFTHSHHSHSHHSHSHTLSPWIITTTATTTAVIKSPTACSIELTSPRYNHSFISPNRHTTHADTKTTQQMTRALQDRLALANVKIRHGWQHMSIDAIEPHLEDHHSLGRKRPAETSTDTLSDSPSLASSRLHSTNLNSSPLLYPSRQVHLNKKIRPSYPHHPSRARTERRPHYAHDSSKRLRRLPESSPIRHIRHARFPPPSIHHNISFVSESSTVIEDPASPECSEDDDADLPVHSFSLAPSSHITSSPPHTPPPDRRMRKAHNVSWSRTPKTGEEGADLLLYLATSPSAKSAAAANASITATTTAAAALRRSVSPTLQPPRTPPCKSTPLPSSHMTPGWNSTGMWNLGPPTTPGNTHVEFADFVHVTPSPAVAAAPCTPAATNKGARRKLHFDHLVPPSPGGAVEGKNQGLGMELGGELVSSK